MTRQLTRADLTDVGLLRPYLSNNESFVTSKRNEVLRSETKAILTKEQWIEFDSMVVKTFRNRTPITQLIAKHVSVLDMRNTGPTPMTLETEKRIDGAIYKLEALPLPFTWCQFSLNPKMQGKWTWPCEAASRRVGEAVEQTTLGMRDSQFGEVSLYGIFNHPKTTKHRIDFDEPMFKDFNRGRQSQLRVDVTVDHMIELSVANKFYGPWALVHGWEYDALLDNDYNGDQTLRQYISREGRLYGRVEHVIRADFIKDYRLALVQMTSDVIRVVVAIDPTLIQWEGELRIICIVVPQVRADHKDHVGIVVAQ